MGALAVPLMIAGTAMSVSGALHQGAMAKAQAEGDAASLEANAMAAKAKAAEESRYYSLQAKKAAREGKAQESAATAAYLAGGVAPNAVVLAQINQDTADQVFEFRRAGSVAYSTGLWEADWMRQMARYTKKGGKLAQRGYTMSAIGSGLSGGAMIGHVGKFGGTTLTSKPDSLAHLSTPRGPSGMGY